MECANKNTKVIKLLYIHQIDHEQSLSCVFPIVYHKAR